MKAKAAEAGDDEAISQSKAWVAQNIFEGDLLECDTVDDDCLALLTTLKAGAYVFDINCDPLQKQIDAIVGKVTDDMKEKLFDVLNGSNYEKVSNFVALKKAVMGSLHNKAKNMVDSADDFASNKSEFEAVIDKMDQKAKSKLAYDIVPKKNVQTVVEAFVSDTSKSDDLNNLKKRLEFYKVIKQLDDKTEDLLSAAELIASDRDEDYEKAVELHNSLKRNFNDKNVVVAALREILDEKTANYIAQAQTDLAGENYEAVAEKIVHLEQLINSDTLKKQFSSVINEWKADLPKVLSDADDALNGDIISESAASELIRRLTIASKVKYGLIGNNEKDAKTMIERVNYRLQIQTYNDEPTFASLESLERKGMETALKKDWENFIKVTLTPAADSLDISSVEDFDHAIKLFEILKRDTSALNNAKVFKEATVALESLQEDDVADVNAEIAKLRTAASLPETEFNVSSFKEFLSAYDACDAIDADELQKSVLNSADLTLEPISDALTELEKVGKVFHDKFESLNLFKSRIESLNSVQVLVSEFSKTETTLDRKKEILANLNDIQTSLSSLAIADSTLEKKLEPISSFQTQLIDAAKAVDATKLNSDEEIAAARLALELAKTSDASEDFSTVVAAVDARAVSLANEANAEVQRKAAEAEAERVAKEKAEKAEKAEAERIEKEKAEKAEAERIAKEKAAEKPKTKKEDEKKKEKDLQKEIAKIESNTELSTSEKEAAIEKLQKKSKEDSENAAKLQDEIEKIKSNADLTEEQKKAQIEKLQNEQGGNSVATLLEAWKKDKNETSLKSLRDAIKAQSESDRDLKTILEAKLFEFVTSETDFGNWETFSSVAPKKGDHKQYYIDHPNADGDAFGESTICGPWKVSKKPLKYKLEAKNFGNDNALAKKASKLCQENASSSLSSLLILTFVSLLVSLTL